MNTTIKLLISFALILGCFTFSYTERVAAQPTGEVTVNVNALNVRSGPGIDHGIVSQVNRGQTFAVLAERNSWYQIQLPNRQTGWVAGWLVQFRPSVSNVRIEPTVNHLNVRSGPGTSFQVLSQIHSGQSYTFVSEQGDWTKIRLNNNREGWVASWLVNKITNSQNVGDSRQGVVTASTLNVRSGPSTSNTIVGKIQRGNNIDILQSQNGWHQIRFQSVQGWVSGQYVQTGGSTGGSNNSNTNVNQPFVTILNDGTNLRRGAGTNHPVVARANQGDRFNVINVVGDWFHIRLSNGQEAYVAGWIVAAEGVNTIKRPGIEQHLRGKTIVIDPGHGGSDSGAVGPHFNTMEKVVNMQVSNNLKTKLEAAGATVHMTRTSDRFVSLQQRVNFSINHRPDAFVSIHHNAFQDRNVHGTMTFFHSNQDRVLAEHIHREVVQQTGFRNLNVRHGNFHVLRQNPAPSVLIELGFLTNYNNELAIRTRQFQENASNGILFGLARYFQNN